MKKAFTSLLIIFALTLSAQETKKVLYIGNSYTSVNDLPNLISKLAIANGDEVVSDQNIPGGATFNNHSTNSTTLNKIAAQNWDYVVLQAQSQKPSFPPAQVASGTKPYAKILVDSIKSNNSCTEPMFYMTWGRQYGDTPQNCASYPPLCTYEGMQQRLRESYMEMAIENDASVAPVGMAWKKFREDFPAVNLYSPDESHPSLEGSYLAACVIYTSIFQKTSVGNTFISIIDSTTAFNIQTIASATVLDSLNLWRIDTNAILPTVTDLFFSACDSIEVNGNWYYNDTFFSDTVVVNAPCDISIVNYNIEINNGQAKVLLFEQIFPAKTLDAAGIIWSLFVENIDSMVLYNNDTIVEVFYTDEMIYTYYCEDNSREDMSFTLVAINECSSDSVTKGFRCGSLSAINDLNQDSWKISPNPTKNFIDIKSESNQNFMTRIIDIAGREVIQKTKKTRIDLSALDKGLYFVILYNNEGLALGQKRILKN